MLPKSIPKGCCFAVAFGGPSPQENFNLPLGPQQTSAGWRAQARIQVAVHTTIIWGTMVDQPVVLTWITHITDKSSAFTHYVLNKTLEGAANDPF